MRRLRQRVGRDQRPRIRQCTWRVVLQALYEPGQHFPPQRPEPLALCHAPVVEAMAGWQIEPVQEFPLQQLGRFFQRLQRHQLVTADNQGVHAVDIDERALCDEADPLAIGVQAGCLRIIDHIAQLAQAPTQGAARIIGAVPQQVAKRLAQLRYTGRDKIAEERARALRRRQRHDTVRAHHLQLSKQANAQRGRGGQRRLFLRDDLRPE